MQIELKSSNRHHVVETATLSEEKVLRELFTEHGIEGDFAVTQTDLHAFEQTRFKVYGDANEIWIAVAVANVADRFGAGDSVELFFDVFHDHLGYCQFCFSASGEAQYFSHLPYAENNSSAFTPPRLLSHHWVRFSRLDVVGAAGVTPVLLARFERAGIFRRGRCCGFNVARYSNALREPSAWNHYAGNFLTDPTGFGNLYSGTAPVEFQVERAALVGDRLELADKRVPKGALSLVDPLGNRHAVKVTTNGKTWRASTRIDRKLIGRYRLYLNAAARNTEPDFLFFDLQPERRRPFTMGMMYDIPDDIRLGFYTPQRLKQQMAQIRACGVTRLHWIDYPDYADFPAFWDLCSNTRNVRETFAACGDLLKTAARTCKQQGMEFIGIFKPFDLGIQYRGLKHPAAGKTAADRLKHGLVRDIDQRDVVAFPEVAAHPEWTMQSNPAWRKQTAFPITRIRLYSEAPLAKLPKGIPILWTSKDNRHFAQYKGGFTLRQGTVQRPHARWTPAGKTREPGEAKNWFIELADLKIEHPYLAIEVKDAAVGLKHRRFMVAEVTDGNGNEAPVTLGDGDLQTGLNFAARWSWQTFTEEILAPFHWNNGMLGMVFALRDNQPTLLDPSFEDVRRLWLRQVKRMVTRGADGVDIRTLCHHNTSASWLTYAFAGPVREMFRARHGREVMPTAADYEQVRRLRGECYTEFIREASRLARSHGKKFSVHLEPGIEVPPQNDLRMQLVLEWEKWIGEGLLDEITLKYWGSQSSFVHERVLPLARKAGIAVHPCDRNFSLNTPRAVELARHLMQDAYAAGFSGFTFYEVGSYFGLNPEGVSWPIGSADRALRRAQI